MKVNRTGYLLTKAIVEWQTPLGCYTSVEDAKLAGKALFPDIQWIEMGSADDEGNILNYMKNSGNADFEFLWYGATKLIPSSDKEGWNKNELLIYEMQVTVDLGYEDYIALGQAIGEDEL